VDLLDPQAKLDHQDCRVYRAYKAREVNLVLSDRLEDQASKVLQDSRDKSVLLARRDNPVYRAREVCRDHVASRESEDRPDRRERLDLRVKPDNLDQ